MSAEQLNKIREACLSHVQQFNLSFIGKYIPRKIIPPVYFLLALVTMAALAHYVPVSHLIYTPLRVFGGLMIFAGFCLSASGAYTFRLQGTPVKPFEQPVKLVTTELYRYSRNPMYLGMIIMLTGTWILLGSFSPVFVIPVFFIIIQEGFIKYEEALLEKIFSDEYLDYKANVRRWIQPDKLMPYGLLADLVVIFHFSFVIFAVFGALLAFTWRWVLWLHLPVALWAAFIEFSGRICPLTPLENSLRLKGGEATYRGGFVENYIIPVLYPAGLTREVQLLLGCAVLLINVLVYWRLCRYYSKLAAEKSR